MIKVGDLFKCKLSGEIFKVTNIVPNRNLDITIIGDSEIPYWLKTSLLLSSYEKVTSQEETSHISVTSDPLKDLAEFQEQINKIANEIAKNTKTEAVPRLFTKCSHSWKHYVGFTEEYDYCEHCDEKRNKR